MTETSEADSGHGASGQRWLVTLGLVAAAWAAFLLAHGYADQLREQWGPAPEVPDALRCDIYVARHILPWFSAAVMLDMAAALSMGVRSRRGWPLALKVAAGLLLVPSAGFHGLVWLVCCFLAT